MARGAQMIFVFLDRPGAIGHIVGIPCRRSHQGQFFGDLRAAAPYFAAASGSGTPCGVRMVIK
jgi:hypothetical protein